MPQTKTSPRPALMAKTKGKEQEDDEKQLQHDEEEDLRQPVKKKRKNPPLKDDTNTKGINKETFTSTSSNNKAPAKKSSRSASRVKGKKTTTTKAKKEQDDDDSVASVSSSGSGKKKIPTKKRKIKKKKIATKTDDEANSDDSDEEPISKMAAKKKASPAKTKKRKAKADVQEDDEDGNDSEQSSSSSSASPTKKKTTKKKAAATTPTSSTKKKKKDKTAKEPVQSITERDELPKLWSEEQTKENGSCTFRIASWNVAGLRAIIRKDPDALAKLVKQHNLDVLCLQETKLQEIHLDDPKLKIRGHILEEEGYDSYYSCSTAKKGYAGTAVFVRRRGPVKGKQKTLDSFFAGSCSSKSTKERKDAAKSTIPVDLVKQLVPEKVTYELGVEKHDKEGRIICLDFPGFSMANLYVPNSGQKLDRLDYRTEEWDKDLVAFAKGKQEERGLPFMWLGDLNVAHKNLEAYNFGAKHLDKQAGLTPQERASFTEQLESGPFFDAFRHLHPTAKGHYSYWSQRAGNREPNKGLRLDYFVCDPSFFQEDSKVIARDSYMISDQLGSDHCPVVLELEIKP